VSMDSTITAPEMALKSSSMSFCMWKWKSPTLRLPE
jgi:hypothetical protein